MPQKPNVGSHLLGPIRDLVENWNVSIAQELEDYLETLEKLHISFDTAHSTETVNFAEAALLIQGSTCIYSKKVEFLWKLVHETLEFVTGAKHGGKGSKRKQGAPDGLASCTRVDPDFLALEGVIKPSANINLVEHGAPDWQRATALPAASGLTPREKLPANIKNRGTPWAHFAATMRGPVGGGALGKADALTLDSMPPVLVAASAGRGSAESAARVLKCEVGRCGMLFLERRQVHGSVLDLGLAGSSEEEHGPGKCDSDNCDPALDQLQPSFDGGGMSDAWTGYADAPAPDVLDGGGAEVGASAAPDSAAVATASDPWGALDPHADSGPCCRSPAPMVMGDLTAGIPPELSAGSSRTSKRRSTALVLDGEASSTMSLGSWTGSLPSRSGVFFSEYAYARRHQRRLAARRARFAGARRKSDDVQRASATGGGWDGASFGGTDAPCADDPFGAGAECFAGDDSFADTASVLPFAGEKAAALGKQPTYVDLVRAHVDQYMHEAEQYAFETQMAKRVRQWQERLHPVMQAEDRRPRYDIHACGEEIVQACAPPPEKGKSPMLSECQGTTCFYDIMKGKEAYEICRCFLASLQMANDGKVAIAVGHDCKSCAEHVGGEILLTQLHA